MVEGGIVENGAVCLYQGIHKGAEYRPSVISFETVWDIEKEYIL